MAYKSGAPCVYVTVTSPRQNDEGVFAYDVVVSRWKGDTRTETKLDRFTYGFAWSDTPWSVAKVAAEERAMFFAEAFGTNSLTDMLERSLELDGPAGRAA